MVVYRIPGSWLIFVADSLSEYFAKNFSHRKGLNSFLFIGLGSILARGVLFKAVKLRGKPVTWLLAQTYERDCICWKYSVCHVDRADISTAPC